MTRAPASPLGALARLAFGALCISFSAVFVKLVWREGMGPTAIGFWRTFFGAAILFGWTLASGRANGRGLRLDPAVTRLALAAGCLFFLDLFFWHRSIVYVGAGMATILANTQVFGTAVLSYFLFRERLGAVFLAAAVSAVAGVVLLIGVGSGVRFTPDYVRGVVFGLLTGVVYANFIVVLKLARQRSEAPGPLPLMAWTSLITACLLGSVGGLTEAGRFVPPNARCVLLLVVLALVAQALGWWSITSSLPHLRGSRSGLALLLQPVLATVWGVVFFGEHLAPVQVAGAVVTIAAIYVGSARS